MKRLLLFLFSAVLALSAYAQPANDDCGGATLIDPMELDDGNGGCNELTGETITDATPWQVQPGLNFTGNCWGGVDTLNVVFYAFDAQGVSGSVEVTSGPDDYFISVIQFNGAGCDGTNATEVGCGNNAPVFWDNDLDIGTTYYVIVAFENNTPGDFNLCVFNPVSAPNDECVNAIELTSLDGAVCNTGQNNYYPSTETPIPACFPMDATYSVWFYFNAQGVSIADLHIDGGPDVANVAVWDFSGQTACDLPNGTILACQTNVDINNPIQLDNDLTIGNDYYIQVTFDNNAFGDFDVCLDAPEQAFNDDCEDAAEYPIMELAEENNCITSIGPDALNNDWPSTDVLIPGCWDPDFTHSVWFTFEAQGPDVDISVDLAGADEQIALIEYQGGVVCDIAAAAVIECSTSADLEVDNTLEIGNIYYVVVGFSDNEVGDYCINIFNPTPPDNDTACAAVMLMTDGSCNSGPPCINDCYTTEYANPEFNPNSFPAECAPYVQNTVWFTIQLDDPNNVGFEIELEEGTGENFTVTIGTFNDCNGQFFVEDFFCDFDYPIEFGPVDDNQVYYVMVGTAEEDEGTFTICVDEIPPCFDNNFCEDPMMLQAANDLGVLTTVPVDADCGTTGDPFTCVEGCNLFADPYEEASPAPCLTPNTPVVWYTFQTDNNASLANVVVTSDEFSAPAFQMFWADQGDCSNLIPIGGCNAGSGGEVTGTGIDVGGGQTYYLAIGGINSAGGDFEVCISIVEAVSNCVTSSEIEVTARSQGGPLEGPFFPGEVVSVCINITGYTAIGNNCQWIQGVIPSFGNGWDPSSFNADWMPVMNTVVNGQGAVDGSGNPIAVGGVYTGQWSWFNDVTYHHDNCWYNVGDFDGNGSLDMCHALFDEDCDGPGLTGGCCANCWQDQPGALLPPGWYAYGTTGNCPTNGHPTVDWGDGNGCGNMSGPWNFCFDLMVREYPDCDQDPSTMDLSIGFITTADGETGAWSGGPSVCANDVPLAIDLPGCCVELEDLGTQNLESCTPYTLSQVLDNPNVDFWEWTVDKPPSIIGPQDGQGPNGTSIISTIENTGSDFEIVTYFINGFSGGDCPSAQMEINVLVYPQIEVDMVGFTACATPTNPYELIPTVSGGDPTSYEYNWSDGSSDPTLMIDAPQAGQQYIVTVTDAAGCEGTAAVTLNVYETFPVNIDAPTDGQCFTDGAILMNVDAEDGTPGYNFEWTSPDGNMFTGTSVDALEEGQWTVTATDSEGCIGEDSISLDFFESPEVAVSPDVIAVCPDNPSPEQIIAIVTGGAQPYQFTWTTPSGIFSTGFIFADEIGNYNIFVTDDNGCTAEMNFDVEEAESPVPDLGQDVALCEEELQLGYEIEVNFDPTYQFYQWSTGEINSSITVFDEGTYQVTVTNTGGCIGTSEVQVSTHPPVVDQFQDSVAFCSGGFAIISANDLSYNYDWSTGANGPEVFIFNEGDVFVTVTDVNGCTAEEQIYVEEAAFLIPVISGDTVICNGVDVTLNVNSGFDTYDWSTGDSDVQTITVGSEGWYYITVSDGDGCFGEDSVFVVESDPMPDITGDAAICDGESATLDVGTWAEIAWSTGESTSTITTDTAGTFTVTVTDATGCSSTDEFVVNTDVSPEPQITGANSFCTGNSTTLDAGGPYSTYEWSTGEMSQTITVSTSSTIYLTVTNAAGCEGFDSLDVTESAALTPDIQGDSIICSGVAVSLDAGSGYTDYAWSNGETTQQITASTANTYIVTVTDASGCTGTDQIVVVASTPAPVINGNNAVCAGGSETLTADAGFDAYVWSTGDITQSISVNASGTYAVTVTDALGCTGTATFDFTVNPNPSPNISGSTTFCVGSSTQLDAGAGYSGYQWSTGDNTQSVTINTEGTVVVTVTDANGCTGTDEVQVIESTELMLNVEDTAICEGDVITLIVGAFDTYDWSTGDMTPTIDVDMGGSYSVTVSDASGCTGSATIVVTENQQPSATVTPSAAICNTSADGSVIDFDTLITAGDASGAWVDVDGSGAGGSFPVLDFDGIAPGQYTFEYTTASAQSPCTDQTYSVTVTVQDCACPDPVFNAPADLCADDGVLDLNTLLTATTAPGGTWSIITVPSGSNPATLSGSTLDATNADAGIYEIQYSISGIPTGCPDSDVQQLTVNAPVDAGIPGQPAQVCVDIDSTIDLSAMLSGADAGGAWVETSISMSQAGFDAASGTFNTALELPGTYTFEYTLQASAPCQSASATVEVVVEDEPLADAGDDRLITCDEPMATLDASGSSPSGQIEYNWYLNGNLVGDGVNLTVNDSGTYELEVINTQTGCISYDYVLVDIDGDIPVMADPNVVSPLCVGQGSASVRPTGVTGGSAPFTYTLNGADPTPDGVYENLQPGDYTLGIEDVNGCTDSYNFTIATPTEVDGRIDGNEVVQSGDSTELYYELTVGVADSTVWFDGDGNILCVNCQTLVIAPVGEMDIFVTIYDANGCEVTLSTTIRVITDRNIHVPNVFSPNDDGENDFVTVYGDEGSLVKNFEIFSRWGELVYRNENFPINDISSGWDGFYQGEMMLPGVYVYHATVVYPDQFEEVVKGDITLIR